MGERDRNFTITRDLEYDKAVFIRTLGIDGEQAAIDLAAEGHPETSIKLEENQIKILRDGKYVELGCDDLKALNGVTSELGFAYRCICAKKLKDKIEEAGGEITVIDSGWSNCPGRTAKVWKNDGHFTIEGQLGGEHNIEPEYALYFSENSKKG